jgi:hypothetical protein
MTENLRDIHLNSLNGEPVVRIVVISNQEFIDFHVFGEFSVIDGENNTIIPSLKSDLKWRVKIQESKAGSERFHLILYETFHQNRIEEKFKIKKLIIIQNMFWFQEITEPRSMPVKILTGLNRNSIPLFSKKLLDNPEAYWSFLMLNMKMPVK